MGRHAQTAASQDGAVGLRVLVPLLLAFAATLSVLVGLPHAPDPSLSIPDGATVEALLRSRYPPLEGVIYVVGMLSWLVWGWLVLSLVLQLGVSLVERVAAGAAWVGQLRTVADWLSVPLVRRAVRVSLAAGVLARVAVGSALDAAAAAPSAPYAQIEHLQPAEVAPSAWHADVAQLAAPVDVQVAAGDVLVTVREGDTLGSLGERFYGSWQEYKVIFDANRDLPQPDGRTLQDARKIYKDWRLIIPQPTQGVDADAHPGVHVVRSGETLSGIAATELGDPRRWPELFALNRDRAHLADGRTLTNPDLIWPDLELRTSAEGSAPATDEAEPPAPAAAAGAPADPAPAAHDGAPEAPTPPPQGAATSTSIASPASVPASPQEPTPMPTATLPGAPVVVDPVISAPAPTAVEHPTSVEDAGSPIMAPAPSGLSDGISGAVIAGTAAIGVAAAGLGLAGMVRRRRRHPERAPQIAIVGGFAAATGDEQVYDARVAALAAHALASVSSQGCPGVRLAGAYAGEEGATLLLTVAEDEVARLAQAVQALCQDRQSASLRRVPGGLYEWTLPWDAVRLHAVTGVPDSPVWLLPLGLAGDRSVLYVERDRAGLLLVAGEPHTGIDDVLATLVCQVARRQTAEALYLVTIADPQRLDPLLAELPHQRSGFVDPHDAEAVVSVLHQLQDELTRRLEVGQGDSPDVLLVVDEWTDLPDADPVLDLLAREGSGAGMRVLAGTTRCEDEGLERWVGLFGTRLVLRVPSEAASVRLLGEPGAEDLDWVGQLWPRLGDAILPRVRSFQISAAHRAYLVEQMRARSRATEDMPVSVGRAGEPDDGEVPAAEPVDEPAAGATGESDVVHAAPAGAPPVAADDAVRVQERGAGPGTGVAHQDAPSGEPAASEPPAVEVDVEEQLVLVPAVAVPHPPGRAAGDRPRPPRVEIRVLGGCLVLVDGETISGAARQAWEIGVLLAALPPGAASWEKLASILWPGVPPMDREPAVRSIVSKLRRFWRTHLTRTDVDRLVLADGKGGYAYNPDLVTVDLHGFLAAARQGDSARAAGRSAEAIAAYRRARELYAGPLLRGWEREFPWLDLHTESGESLTLRDVYERQDRELRQYLGALLVGAGRLTEAVSVYHGLLVDPDPPVGVEDEDQGQHQLETYARALFQCYGRLRDLPGLVQAWAELGAALRRLDALGVESALPSQPSEATVVLFEAIRHELTGSGMTAAD